MLWIVAAPLALTVGGLLAGAAVLGIVGLLLAVAGRAERRKMEQAVERIRDEAAQGDQAAE